MKKLLVLSVGILCAANIQAMEDRIEWKGFGRILREQPIDPLEVAISESNIDRQNESIKEQMRLAGRDGSLERAQLLIREYPYASSQEALISLLVSAARSGNFELIKFAIDRGANVEGEKGDSTPLIEAALRGYTQIARYLIEHGARTNAHSFLWGTPLAAALRKDHLETARAILTTIQPSEIQKLKAAVASIKFGTPLIRDVRKIITLELIRQFAQEHMKYASGLLDDPRLRERLLWQEIGQKIDKLKEPQSWSSLKSEVESNFLRALVLPSVITKEQQGVRAEQLTTEQMEDDDDLYK